MHDLLDQLLMNPPPFAALHVRWDIDCNTTVLYRIANAVQHPSSATQAPEALFSLPIASTTIP